MVRSNLPQRHWASNRCEGRGKVWCVSHEFDNWIVCDVGLNKAVVEKGKIIRPSSRTHLNSPNERCLLFFFKTTIWTGFTVSCCGPWERSEIQSSRISTASISVGRPQRKGFGTFGPQTGWPWLCPCTQLRDLPIHLFNTTFYRSMLR